MKDDMTFSPSRPLETAVLFLVFNRLDTTKQVFEAIHKAKPPRIYIAADGPREGLDGEVEKVQKIHEYVLNNIDWVCEVKTLFRDKNLGCKYGVSEAITWFFENEEMGIILEDDCIPSQSFFWFCEELLKRYKNDKRIWQIGGCNFQDGIKRGDGSYYFSIFSHIWGWASWKERWDKYNADFCCIKNDDFIFNLFKNKNGLKYWRNIFKKMKNGSIDSWCYPWSFTIFNNNGLVITPNVNMVSNIGFGLGATHTPDKRDKNANMIIGEINKIIHPLTVCVDREADEYTLRKHYLGRALIKKIVHKFLDGIIAMKNLFF